ncbi:LLM class flavin-dependent oxidoreductase [Streptomyces sp. NPDC006197]|uniref:LLM class flavin-dependent oxidoreductase n=1 Tax=Streptomyces sp. NPDC006197 TaxID=3156685 RepID=UPI0033AB674C
MTLRVAHENRRPHYRQPCAIGPGVCAGRTAFRHARRHRPQDERYVRTGELMGVVRELLDGAAVTLDGRQVRVREVRSKAPSVETPVPLYLGGASPGPRASRHATPRHAEVTVSLPREAGTDVASLRGHPAFAAPRAEPAAAWRFPGRRPPVIVGPRGCGYPCAGREEEPWRGCRRPNDADSWSRRRSGR